MDTKSQGSNKKTSVKARNKIHESSPGSKQQNSGFQNTFKPSCVERRGRDQQFNTHQARSSSQPKNQVISARCM